MCSARRSPHDRGATSIRSCSHPSGAVPGKTFRWVLLSGNVYLRLDEFASGRLLRRFNDRGLMVIVEPVSLLGEYMAEERQGELIGLPRDRKDNLILKHGMAAVRHGLYRHARRLHPWFPTTDMKTMPAASRAVLDQHPIGEAPIPIGILLPQRRTGAVDGSVAVSPRGSRKRVA